MKLDTIAKEKEELEVKDVVQISTTNAKNFTYYQDFISQYQQESKTKKFNAVAQVNKWKRVIISPQRAIAMAKNIFVRGDLKRLCAIYNYKFFRKQMFV